VGIYLTQGILTNVKRLGPNKIQNINDFGLRVNEKNFKKKKKKIPQN